MKTLIFDPLTEKYFVADWKIDKGAIVITLYCIFGGRFINSVLISHLDEVEIPGLVDEKFIFDFVGGKVILQVRDAVTEKLIFSRNISAHEEIYATDLPLLFFNNTFREDIVKLFARMWRQSVPYSSSNITADRLVLMTMFVGYSERFYDALPIDMKTGRICREYRNVAKKLHRADSIIKMVKNAQIPQTKGVKRIIYQNEALVFYIPLLEWMWSISNENVKGFVSCLEYIVSSNYQQLVYLSSHSEEVKKSVEEFREITGFSLFKIMTMLRRHPEYMPYYASLSKLRQKAEREGLWVKLKGSCVSYNTFDFSDEIISRPLSCDSYGIDVYTKGAFGFVPCTSLHQLRGTGKSLRNCLENTEDPDLFDNVFRVYKHNRIVGAVEVTRNRIVQCRAENNKEIGVVDGFSEAVKEFAQKNNFTFYVSGLRDHYHHLYYDHPQEENVHNGVENDMPEFDDLLDDLLL